MFRKILAVVIIAGCGGSAADPPFTAPMKRLPCDVDSVLVRICQQCHSSPPVGSAPFPLITYDDTQAMFAGQPVWMMMGEVVGNGFMPPSGVDISGDDRNTIVLWSMDGAPPAGPMDACP